MCYFYRACITEKCQLFVFYYIQKFNFCVMDWLTPCHVNWLLKLQFTIISNSQFCMHSNFCVMDWLVLCHLNWLFKLRFTIISNSQFCMMHACMAEPLYIHQFLSFCDVVLTRTLVGTLSFKLIFKTTIHDN